MKGKTGVCVWIWLICGSALLFGQRHLGHVATNSGGPLLPEQAAYDVVAYDVSLTVDPKLKQIQGTTVVSVRVVHPLEWLVLDLDPNLKLAETHWLDGKNQTSPAKVQRRDKRLWIHTIPVAQPGDLLRISISYGGVPREAPAPPWIGGFTWAETASGEPWISTTTQFDGSDIWFPCKDHPSDEPEKVDLRIRVPKPLVVATNGILQQTIDHQDKSRTYHWQVKNPVNNYGLALNIAPYKTIEGQYQSVGGQTVPITFWVLPEFFEQGSVLFPQFAEHLAFYEKFLGPYPFRNEKYGIAHTPHLGMEHQTIIAYGANFENNAFGYDTLHHHELGHEWWGNLVTALDWRDFWIHEGFCSYMQALYAETLKGETGYHAHFKGVRERVRNNIALAPRESKSVMEMYFVAPDFTQSDGDIYTKGSLILHALRFLIGKDLFLKSLRKMAYPTPDHEMRQDGSQCRFVTTDEYLKLVEDLSGMELGWFFEIYLRQPHLPELVVKREGPQLNLTWKTPSNMPFPMPIEVEINGELRRIPMKNGRAKIMVPEDSQWMVDPKNWVFKKQATE